MVMGSSTGGFAYPRSIVVGPRPVQIEAADFDRDGHLDLAVLSVDGGLSTGSEYAQTLHVLPGDGEGGFVAPYVIALGGARPDDRFAVGDYDGDGWLDLALLEPSLLRVRTAINRSGVAGLAGEGIAFAESGGAWLVEAGASDIAAGDFDRDGRDDVALAFASGGAGRVALMRRSQSGEGTETASLPLEVAPRRLACAPMDRDETMDLVVGCSDGSDLFRVCLIAGDGAGGLLSPQSVSLPAAPAGIAVGDLDGSGLPDMVLAHPERASLSSVLVRRSGPHRSLFVRGDVNGVGGVDLADAVAGLLHLFLGAEIDCQEALDSDDDFALGVSDPVHILSFLFRGGETPKPPFPRVGEDPAEETLGCDRAR